MVAEEFAGRETEDHQRERRDEVERVVALLVEGEGLVAGEEVEEPGVEAVAWVGVEVPVGEQAGRVVCPTLGLDCGEIGGRRGDREPRPPGDEDTRSRAGLHEQAAVPEQEQEYVAETNLGDDVLEGPVGMPRVVRTQEHAEQNEDEGAGGSMAEHSPLAVAEALAFPVRVGHRDANHEHERRLDQIPEHAARPVDVAGVVRDPLDEAVIW